MSESVFNRQLARLRVAYAASPLKRFLTWWGRELWALAPAPVRALFADRREEVLIRLTPATVELTRGRREPQVFERTGDPAELQATLARLLSGEEEPPRAILALPPERVLVRAITLPAAAEENLRQVLSFEMDRQTPFRADQIYFDQRVAHRDIAAKQIKVELALVPRASVDPDLSALSTLGVALDGADSAAPGELRAGFNLLPAEKRAHRRNIWLTINLALAAVVVIGLFVVMVQSVSGRAAALEKLRVETERVHTEAKAVAALRNTLRDAIDGANFLVEKKGSRPPLSDLLLDVTRLLGNDTWLQRLSLNGDQVQLQGQSKEAAGLITILQQSKLMESPALQGAITPDARTGKEQFLIQAKVKKPAAPARAKTEAKPAEGEPPTSAPTSAPAPEAPAETSDAAAAQG